MGEPYGHCADLARPTGHSFGCGMRYGTCFNQELREESQRKSWNEIVNQHWSCDQRTRSYCEGFLHIFICTGKLHNICWTILQGKVCLNLQSFSDLVCLSLLNLFPNNLHIFLVTGTFPGTPPRITCPSAAQIFFTFLASCRRSSRCS